MYSKIRTGFKNHCEKLREYFPYDISLADKLCLNVLIFTSAKR